MCIILLLKALAFEKAERLVGYFSFFLLPILLGVQMISTEYLTKNLSIEQYLEFPRMLVKLPYFSVNKTVDYMALDNHTIISFHSSLFESKNFLTYIFKELSVSRTTNPGIVLRGGIQKYFMCLSCKFFGPRGLMLLTLAMSIYKYIPVKRCPKSGWIHIILGVKQPKIKFDFCMYMQTKGSEVFSNFRICTLHI